MSITLSVLASLSMETLPPLSACTLHLVWTLYCCSDEDSPHR